MERAEGSCRREQCGKRLLGVRRDVANVSSAGKPPYLEGEMGVEWCQQSWIKWWERGNHRRWWGQRRHKQGGKWRLGGRRDVRNVSSTVNPSLRGQDGGSGATCLASTRCRVEAVDVALLRQATDRGRKQKKKKKLRGKKVSREGKQH
jgi:hypothetical protein